MMVRLAKTELSLEAALSPKAGRKVQGRGRRRLLLSCFPIGLAECEAPKLHFFSMSGFCHESFYNQKVGWVPKSLYILCWAGKPVQKINPLFFIANKFFIPLNSGSRTPNMAHQFAIFANSRTTYSFFESQSKFQFRNIGLEFEYLCLISKMVAYILHVSSVLTWLFQNHFCPLWKSGRFSLRSGS